MRVVLSTYGSRGDVEPVAALAARLQALSAEVMVSAPADEEFVELLVPAGVPLAPAFTPVRRADQGESEAVDGGGFLQTHGRNDGRAVRSDRHGRRGMRRCRGDRPGSVRGCRAMRGLETGRPLCARHLLSAAPAVTSPPPVSVSRPSAR